MGSPKAADWIGSWSHPGGTISITRGDRGKLSVEGEHTYPAAQNVHSGVIGAAVVPARGKIAIADDGSVPAVFHSRQPNRGLVRMQRVGLWLLVEDTCSAAVQWSSSPGFIAASRYSARRAR